MMTSSFFLILLTACAPQQVSERAHDVHRRLRPGEEIVVADRLREILERRA